MESLLENSVSIHIHVLIISHHLIFGVIPLPEMLLSSVSDTHCLLLPSELMFLLFFSARARLVCKHVTM
jgi:hypothetical protein